MFFELRQYRIKPGQETRWATYMDEVIIPFQVSKGMVVVGSYVGQQETDLYVWMRRFESEEERVALYKAVYETDTWLKEIKPQVDEMLDREKGIVVTRIEPTPRSIIR